MLTYRCLFLFQADAEASVEASVDEEVVIEVGAAEAVVLPVVLPAVAELVDEAAPVVEEAPTLSSSPTGIRVSSLPKEKTICWSPKILFPATLYTARSGYRSRAVLRARRQSTAYGTLSVRSWLLVFSVVWMISSSSPVPRCSTLVLLAERVSAMLLILSDL